uniref:Rab3 GTPase-activating protein non-catalytic subunit n=1 Tax=Cacopsylla melanoneura TaxID=428564 RepID=A0A8D8UHV9_9HEMI
MSCSLKVVGSIADLDEIWQDLNISKRTEGDPVLPEDCLSAISPIADILVLSRLQTFCVLKADWSTSGDDQGPQFHLSWTKNISVNSNENNKMETITAVIVLPVASSSQSKTRKSTNSVPEWACIAVGLSSGYIRFYTDEGDLLLSHRVHNEPLSRLKAQSFSPPRHSTQPEQQEELYAFFTSVICVFPGFPLFSTLKAVRNQLTRVQDTSSTAADTPLTFSKWRLTDQHKVSDCIVTGTAPTNTYHHLLTASMCGGYNTSYKNSAPQSTQIIATGAKPFVGFHYAMEGPSHQILTDVAKVVANKLKSAIGQSVSSWFMGGSKNTVPTEETIEPAEDMGCRFGLCDAWRQGIDVVLSPLRSTCVITDFLGRLSLVDTVSGVVLRQWKGYRDAQTGWITLEEDASRSKTIRRTALFLVVYAPKRHTLDVWAMQQGPKVSSFTLNQPGRLLYTGHGLMGQSVPSKPRQNAPLLFLGDNGVIMELEVPFHCILTEKNSTRARDLHLLKKLRCAIRDHINEESKLLEEAKEVGSQLVTVAIIREALGHLTNASHVTPLVLDSFLCAVKDRLTATTNEDDNETGDSSENEEKQCLVRAVHMLQSVIRFYEYIVGIHDVPPDYACVVDSRDEMELEDLSKKLSISTKELTRVSALITSEVSCTTSTINTPAKKHHRVKFSDASNFTEYVRLFTILDTKNPEQKKRDNPTTRTNENKRDTTRVNDKRQSSVEEEEKSLDDGFVHINASCSQDTLIRVSSVMFQGVVYGSCSLTQFMEQCKASMIGAEDLMRLALLYWSNKEHGSNIYKEMIQFSNVLKYICIAKETCSSSWWSNIRSQLSKCANPLSAMTAALICRGVSIQWNKHLDQPERLEEDDDIDWESYDTSSCEWSLLIGQLEDISILDRSTTGCIVVSQDIALEVDQPRVTLEYVLAQGRGCVTEVVARWLCSCGFNPHHVVDRQDTEFTMNNNTNANSSPNKKNRITGVAEGMKPHVEESVEAKPLNPNEVKVLETLKNLKQHFPFSLSCSTLLAHMCWEYIGAYETHPHRLELLNACFNCLEQIQSSHIKQGLCYLLWTQHLRVKFESCLRLLHKVGKLPKELLCKQDLKVSDTQIASFLQLFSQYFEQYIQANLTSEVCERPRIQYEPFWEGRTRPSPTFVQLSLTQPPATYEFLHLLLQTTHAFHIMVAFSLRVPKPLNAFFDSASQSGLFTDIHSKSFSVSRIVPDSKLVESRTKFLLRALTNVIQLIQTDLNPDGEVVYQVNRCTPWISRIMELGAEWSVSSDLLRRHQVCELYASGYDQLAQEITPLVSETSLLGSQLLVILGLRMKLVLQNTKNTQLKSTLSCLSPSITAWLDALNLTNEMNIESTELAAMADFSQTIVNLLPEDHQDRHMANLLAECLPQIVHNNTSR